MPLKSKELVEQAKAATESITVGDAIQLFNHPAVVFVDLRDSNELMHGVIPGSVHSPRGGLEFALDRESGFATETLLRASRLVMVCGSGGRACLAAKLARDMGHEAVWLEGGLRSWISAGGPLAAFPQ